MVSIGKLAVGQEGYYLEQAQGRVDRATSVGSGVEDYYEMRRSCSVFSPVVPAAGIAWGSEQAVHCEVEWADGQHVGKIIYIPQNSLFALSSRPEEITQKIAPALYEIDEGFGIDHRRATSSIDSANASIRDAITRWFALGTSVSEARAALADLGDPAAVEAQRDALTTKIAKLREASTLSERDITAYQRVVDRTAAIAGRQQEIQTERGTLATYVIRDEADDEAVTYHRTPAFRVDVRLFPEVAKLPPELEVRIAGLVDTARAGAEAEILSAIETYQRGLDTATASLRGESWRIAQENAELIARNRANEEIEALIVDRNAQNEALGRIRQAKQALDQIEAQRAALATSIADASATRTAAIDALDTAFQAKPRRLQRMTFELERQVTDDTVKRVSEQLNKLEHGPYVRDRAADVAKAQAEPAAFLDAMESGDQKVLQNSTAEAAAVDMLTVTPEIRFYAELEGDRIGGFKPSSMTPGKQAFFALSLILSQDQEEWPLLIDQPEDDLDSRSVYDVLVDYLKARKAERQIIMVSTTPTWSSAPTPSRCS